MPNRRQHFTTSTRVERAPLWQYRASTILQETKVLLFSDTFTIFKNKPVNPDFSPLIQQSGLLSQKPPTAQLPGCFYRPIFELYFVWLHGSKKQKYKTKKGDINTGILFVKAWNIMRLVFGRMPDIGISKFKSRKQPWERKGARAAFTRTSRQRGSPSQNKNRSVVKNDTFLYFFTWGTSLKSRESFFVDCSCTKTQAPLASARFFLYLCYTKIGCGSA